MTSTAIRSDAIPDLNKVVPFMRDNPKASVDLSSHIDNRVRDSYHLSLSQRRAKSAVDYVIAQGILSFRIKGQVYGKPKLLKSYADGVN